MQAFTFMGPADRIPKLRLVLYCPEIREQIKPIVINSRKLTAVSHYRNWMSGLEDESTAPLAVSRETPDPVVRACVVAASTLCGGVLLWEFGPGCVARPTSRKRTWLCLVGLSCVSGLVAGAWTRAGRRRARVLVPMEHAV